MPVGGGGAGADEGRSLVSLEERVAALEAQVLALSLELAERTSAVGIYNALYLDRKMGVDATGNATHPMVIEMTTTTYDPDLPVPGP